MQALDCIYLYYLFWLNDDSKTPHTCDLFVIAFSPMASTAPTSTDSTDDDDGAEKCYWSDCEIRTTKRFKCIRGHKVSMCSNCHRDRPVCPVALQGCAPCGAKEEDYKTDTDLEDLDSGPDSSVLLEGSPFAELHENVARVTAFGPMASSTVDDGAEKCYFCEIYTTKRFECLLGHIVSMCSNCHRDRPVCPVALQGCAPCGAKEEDYKTDTDLEILEDLDSGPDSSVLLEGSPFAELHEKVARVTAFGPMASSTVPTLVDDGAEKCYFCEIYTTKRFECLLGHIVSMCSNCHRDRPVCPVALNNVGALCRAEEEDYTADTDLDSSPDSSSPGPRCYWAGPEKIWRS